MPDELDQATLDTVRAVRRRVRLDDARPNDGRCGHVSDALEQELGWVRQWGYLRLLDGTVSWVHCWNRRTDGSLVDATADQFQDLWLGDIVVLAATDPRIDQYLHSPADWTLHFEPSDEGLALRCTSAERTESFAASDGAHQWLNLADAVLQLLTGWELPPQLVELAARTLRARASTSGECSSREVVRPLVNESIRHLGARGGVPWVATEFLEPL